MTEDSQPDVQRAEFLIQGKPPILRASVQVTPAGLLAIAALVSSILLSTCAIVYVAGTVRRKNHFPRLT
jgi:hypothetical protein